MRENMEKYVRVAVGLRSNAGNFAYKLDEINVASNWNPKESDPEKMGGFNFGTEDKILRWLHRGDTLYDVVIPSDTKVIQVDEEKGIYRSNKIIITNPRKITDDLVFELYKKNTLSNKVMAQCLVALLWRGRINVSKYIISDYVNENNIDEIIREYENYIGNGNFNYESLFDDGKEIYNLLKEISLKYHNKSEEKNGRIS